MPNRKIFSIEGGSVQTNEGLYIRRSADDDLLELCRAGAFAYVLTPRQLGKSSLMEGTAESLVEEGIKPIIIDLQEIGVKLTVEQWYKGLLTKIEEQTTLKTNVSQWWAAHGDLGMGQRLVLFLRDVLLAEVEPQQRVVIFVDEIDTTLSLDFTDDFFTAIRAIYSARPTTPQFRRLSFVLIGVAAPTDLITDPKRTPFNIGRRVDLTDFTFEEVMPLAQGLGLPEDEARRVLGWVLSWTGGHPFLTQRLCYAIAKQRRSSWTEHDVDRVVVSTFFGEGSSEDKSNIEFVRDMLTKRAPDREAVLKVYGEVLRGKQSVVDEESLVKSHLKLSGVVRSEDGVLRVRNRIYREIFNEVWVKRHTPTNWARRLTRAAAALIVVFLFLSVPIGAFAIYQWRQAASALEVARQERSKAEEQRLLAVQLATAARSSAEQERLARKDAETAAEKEQTARSAAEESAAQAREAAESERLAKEYAEEQRADAVSQKARADAAATLAETRRIEADKQRQLAERNQLTSQALASQREGRLLQPSVLLAAASLRDAYSSSAYEVLRQGLALMAPPVRNLDYNDGATDIIFSEDGQYLLSGARLSDKDKNDLDSVAGKSVLALRKVSDVKDVSYPQISADPLAQLTSISFSPDRKFLATIVSSTASTKPPVSIIAPGATAAASPVPSPVPIKVWKWEGKKVVEWRSLYLNDASDVFALSPNGKYLAMAKRNAPIEIEFSAHATSSQRQTGTTGTYAQGQTAGVLALVEVETGREVDLRPKTLGNVDGKVTAISFSAARDLMATAYSDGTVIIWKLEGTEFNDKLRARPGPGISAVAFSPDGNYLVTAASDNAARVWDLKETQRPSKEAATVATITGHGGRIMAIAFSPDGKYLATASVDNTARLWNNWLTDTPAEAARITHDKSVTYVNFSPDGKLFTSASFDGTARVWRVPGTYKGTVKTLQGRSYRGLFSQNRRFLVTLSPEGVTAWDLSDGAGKESDGTSASSPGREIFKYKIEGMERGTSGVAISEDGKLVAMILEEAKGQSQQKSRKIMSLWDTDSNRMLWSIPLDGVVDASAGTFSPGNKYLALASRTTGIIEVRFFDVRQRKEVARRKYDSLGSEIGLIFTPDGEHVVAVDDGAVRVREVVTGKQVGPAVQVIKERQNITISRTGRYVAELSAEGNKLSVSDTSSGTPVFSRILDEAQSVEISPNEKQIAVITGKGIEVMTISNTPATLAMLPYIESIDLLSFTDDGQYLAVTDSTGVRIWKVLGGCEEVASIKVPNESGYFNPEGKYLLTGGFQQVQLHLWRREDLLGEVCNYITRNLSLNEWRNQYMMGNRDLPKTCPDLLQNTVLDQELLSGCEKQDAAVDKGAAKPPRK